MRIPFLRMERFRSEVIARPSTTSVRIDMLRTPTEYSFAWRVVDRPRRRLSKRELHELGMRVDKYVAAVNQMAPPRLEQSTVYVVL